MIDSEHGKQMDNNSSSAQGNYKNAFNASSSSSFVSFGEAKTTGDGKGNFLYAIIGFLFPIIGVLLAVLLDDKSKADSRMALKGVLCNIVLSVVAVILWIMFLMFCVFCL